MRNLQDSEMDRNGKQTFIRKGCLCTYVAGRQKCFAHHYNWSDGPGERKTA